jgi:DNA-binding phage protein
MNIREQIIDRDIGRSQLAREVGIGPGVLKTIEAGGIPRVDHVAAVAAYYGRPLRDVAHELIEATEGGKHG